MKTGASLQALLLVVTGVALLVLPNVADNYVIYIGARLFVYILVALGLNLLTGYAGQVSLGHAAFFAIGAYTAAVLAESLHWPFVICVIVSAFFTAIVGYLLGLPCLRLSGLYLAMATLGFTLIVQEMLLQLSVITHGSEGMSVPTASILGVYLRFRLPQVLPIIRRDHRHADTDAESGTGADGAGLSSNSRERKGG
jgi:branched-chain amino acid transport system permease protein